MSEVKPDVRNVWNRETMQWETYCGHCGKVVCCINRDDMAANNAVAEARQERAYREHRIACGAP